MTILARHGLPAYRSGMTQETGLRTGWEPDVPVGDTVARRFAFAYADRVTAMARARGGRVEHRDDARIADLGSPFGYDNAVVLLRPPDPDGLAALLARAADVFPPHRWWALLSLWPTPDLRQHGLVPVGHPPLMLRPPGPLPAPPPGLEIREVTGRDDVAEFSRVLAAGYPVPAGDVPVAEPGVVGSVVRLFVGSVAGRAIGVAGSAVHHGLVEVDWVAVLPEARGRGYGSALTAAAAAVAPDLPAVLLSSDDGRPTYRRLGFIDLFRVTLWEHPPG
jgi:GNAT superfamily N-acetyltransferase